MAVSEVKFDEIKTLIKPTLKYLEVGPCADAFKQILDVLKAANSKTVIRAQFDLFEMVGKLNGYNIFIYDMTKSPTVQTRYLPVNNAYLGLRFDADRLSSKWGAFLFRFKELKHLNVDCKLDVLREFLAAKDSFSTALKLLSKITLTINETNMVGLGDVDIRETIEDFLMVFQQIKTVNLNLTTRQFLDVAPICQFQKSEMVDGKNQRMYSCSLDSYFNGKV